MEKLYPLIFRPILKELIWGGTDILPFKGMSQTDQTIGESWELSHVDNNYSVVANGNLVGANIDELIKEYSINLLGHRVMDRFGTKFPLLIKFIDARKDLSVQVHPNDALALKRHNSFGKTEMWYVVKAAENASLYSGFSRQSSPDEYIRLVDNNKIMDVLQRFEVKTGDVFFLPAGRVHAIGAGCFIAEIQQTSDVTYRIYDYNRCDVNGNRRELHTALAINAIDYNYYPEVKTYYLPENDKPVNLASCQYFTTNLLSITKPIKINNAGSFKILINTKGNANIIDNNGYIQLIRQGQTVLIPASTTYIDIVPLQDTTLLEVFV